MHAAIERGVCGELEQGRFLTSLMPTTRHDADMLCASMLYMLEWDIYDRERLCCCKRGYTTPGLSVACEGIHMQGVL